MKSHILLVEDEYANRFLMENVLDEYDVRSVKDANSMWEYLNENVPDIILLDIELPDANGLQLAKRIVAEDRLHNVPIIFVTARNTGKDAKAAFEAGGYDYVTKPIDDILLKARIENAISKKKHETELKQMSIIDPLTNIYNRRYLFYTLPKNFEYSKREQKSLSIAMLDIDFFKKINDTYGHLAGDYILQQFSLEIKSSIRPYDMAARYGGEEFVIMFLDCNKFKSSEIVARLKKNITGNTFTFEKQEIRFAFSCGIADETDLFGKEDIGSENLLKIADERLYKAKKEGRNRIVISNGEI